MNHRTVDNAPPRLWIISPPQYLANFAFHRLGLESIPGTARAYRISTIGHYLVSPTPLNVPRRLIGCEIRRRPAPWIRWKQILAKWLGRERTTRPPDDVLLSDFRIPRVSPSDAGLKRHLGEIRARLCHYDGLLQRLDRIDARQVVNVVGICADDAGHRTHLTIEGDCAQQLDFVRASVGREINVRLKQAYIGDGLFEMKGFDFCRYDPEKSFQLIRFVQDGIPRACVVDEDQSPAFWLDDAKMVNYLQMFEFSIQQNPHMRESLDQCMAGNVTPLRLMVNHALEVDYSHAPLPTAIQEAIGGQPLEDHASRLLKENLNLHQVGVSFHSHAHRTREGDGYRTDISIFQNIRALEPIKQRLPEVFAGINQRVSRSDGGNFYLLDAIRGVDNGI